MITTPLLWAEPRAAAAWLHAEGWLLRGRRGHRDADGARRGTRDPWSIPWPVEGELYGLLDVAEVTGRGLLEGDRWGRPVEAIRAHAGSASAAGKGGPWPNLFRRWLEEQAGRDDIVGDLADDHLRDPLPPSTNVSTIERELKRRGACKDAIIAARHAAREFFTGKPTPTVKRIQRENALARDRSLSGDVAVGLKSGMWMDGKFYRARRPKRPA